MVRLYFGAKKFEIGYCVPVNRPMLISLTTWIIRDRGKVGFGKRALKV